MAIPFPTRLGADQLIENLSYSESGRQEPVSNRKDVRQVLLRSEVLWLNPFPEPGYPMREGLILL